MMSREDLMREESEALVLCLSFPLPANKNTYGVIRQVGVPHLTGLEDLSGLFQAQAFPLRYPESASRCHRCQARISSRARGRDRTQGHKAAAFRPSNQWS